MYEVQDACGSQEDIDMSNQLCYVFRESNPIIRHNEMSHQPLSYRRDLAVAKTGIRK